MRTTCMKCGRTRGQCSCEDVCQRCLCVSQKCSCERSLREERYQNDDAKFEPDEEVQDQLVREYHQETTDVYWHGFNTARSAGGGRRKFIKCPDRYQGNERKEFYRGVSDARSRM